MTNTDLQGVPKDTEVDEKVPAV